MYNKRNNLPTIFCHVVGLCAADKSPFVSFCKFNKNIIIHDFNDLNSEYCNQLSKTAQPTAADWKHYIHDRLLELFIRDAKKIIILLGYPMHYNDKRTRVTINAKLKCFVKMNDFYYTSNTILNNITQYQEEIIHGEFPLKYLDPDFLVINRQSLIKLFSTYTLKSMPRICKAIQLNIQKENKLRQIKTLFCTHEKKFEKIMPVSHNGTINAYTEEWLSLVSYGSQFVKSSCTRTRNGCQKGPKGQKGIIKGFKHNKPYIKEIAPKAFNALNRPAYLYSVEQLNFLFHEKGKEKKMSTNSSVIIIRRKRVPNIYKYLVKYTNVTMYHFKSGSKNT